MPIVRRGAPVGRNIGPLQGMSFDTVEGPLRLGYMKGGRGRRGMSLYLPIDPTVPNPVPVKPVVKGVGAFTRGRGMGAAFSACVKNLRSGESNCGLSGNYGDYGPVSMPGDRLQFSVTGAASNSPVSMWFAWPGAPVQMSGMRDAAGDLLGWTEGTQKTDGAGNWSWSSAPLTKQMAGTWVAHVDVAGGSPQYAVGFQVDGGYGFDTYGAKTALSVGAAPLLDAGTPYYLSASNHPATDVASVPKPVVQSLAEQLAARNETMLSTGQLVPIVNVTTGGAGNPGSKVPAGGGGSITDLVSGFSLSTIPTWGWIAAAGVGALLIFGGHKH